MFKKLLIANRGEIAVRIARSCHDLDVVPVGVYSEADREAPFLDWMDEAYALGGRSAAESYLDIARLIDAARRSGVDALHPGYGFLAENPDLPRACAEAGVAWIGPSAEAIEAMGDKAEARKIAKQAGVPLTPGTDPVSSADEVRDFARQHGFPIAIKAVAGGGGRGLRVVRSAREIARALETASREGQLYFGNPAVYVEKFLEDPKHIEIQVLGTAMGEVYALGERDCSVQRRHQKLIEEAPGPTVTSEIRDRMEASAIALAESVGYRGAGTVEFLLAPDGSHYFLEMNTRIQVEHPVTELVRNCDLVAMQIMVAAGEEVQSASCISGHAIECRINAENIHRDFRPSPGTVTEYREPAGPGVRVDGGVRAGYTIPSEYDSMLAKLIAFGSDREQARARMLRALHEYRIEGVPTTIPAVEWVLRHPEFVSGKAGTAFLSEHASEMMEGLPPEQPDARMDAEDEQPPRRVTVEVNGRRFKVAVWGLSGNSENARRPHKPRLQIGASTGRGEETVLRSPIQGNVLRVAVSEGDTVVRGDLVCVIEAMKMENEISAHKDGTVRKVHVEASGSVSGGAPIVEIE